MEIRIDTHPTFFYATAQYADKDILKEAGFKWDTEARWWSTESLEVLEKLVSKCDRVVLSMDTYNLLTGRAHWEFTYDPDPFTGNQIEDVYLVTDDISTPKTTGKKLPDTDDPLLIALRILAGNDPDFAQQRNNIGFNGSDANMGHSLANFPYLSEKQKYRARKILKKYHRQIPADIYNQIFPDPKEEADPTCSDCEMASEEF